MNQVNNTLLKLFSVTSVVTLIIAVVSIGLFYKTFAVNLLEEQSAKTNAVLSKIIYNSIHIGIETKLGVKYLFDDESIEFISSQKNHPFLKSIIQDSIEQTPVVKVKIYNPKLKTIFSTIKENIGKTIDDVNIRKVIETGESYTDINHYEKFLLDGNTLNNVTLLTTYIPMTIAHEMEGSESKEYGLFGIYVDVTKRYESIVSSQWGFVSVITVVLLIIYSTLYFEVRKINKTTNQKQKNLDDELRKAEKTNLVLGKNFAKVATKRDRAVKENEAKSQFLANMSHELRTPLNAIIGYSEMISDDMDDGDTSKVKEDSKRINSAGKHLLIIINDILDISKIEAGKMELNIEDFNVDDMINEIIATSKPLADKNNNKLIVVSNKTTVSITSDLTRTRQILLNLISNAIKFTKDGDIFITINDSKLDGRDSVEFVVQDTGVGLDDKYIKEIFSPFNQADLSSSKKYEGTGLGLTISKLFCELMNGDISVSSTLGQGATFTVNIPVLVSSSKYELAENDNVTKHREYCANVVIVDSDPSAKKLLTSYLCDLKFYVIFASTALDCVRVAQNNNVDIIILDVQSSGMDDWLLLKNLKNNIKTRNIRIIVTASKNELELTKSLGADAYIVKPFNKEIVEETVCNIVGGSDSVVSIQ
ncbi:hypothetical protein MNBD_GAMMA22-1574 [hydrothermal vent metagenome]|uniref:histidine kinase n=1 Tax=hydrothermal vent metagenome TaxID=652676 RepID=A0A3B1AF47_9ZZZZ